jgi:hypothetical protein
MNDQDNDIMGPGPIFIGGISFSGKTILHAMLSAHPRIIVTRHTYMWPKYYQQFGDLSRAENFERCLTAMLQDKHIRALNPNAERIRSEFWQGVPTYGRLFSLFHLHYAGQIGKSRWGEQLSFIERYADPILANYPNARMIHMIRDPRDRYKESLDHSPHRLWKVGLETANWLYSARLAERNQRQYNSSYKVVRYESVVADPEGTMREVCNFLQEDFVPAMLAPANRIETELEGDDQAGYEHNSITQSRKISEREIGYIQMYARNYMLANAYPLKTVQLPLKDRLRFYAVDWPANLASLGAGHLFLSWRE